MILRCCGTEANALWNDPYREVTTTTLDIARALGVPVTDLLEQVPDNERA